MTTNGTKRLSITITEKFTKSNHTILSVSFLTPVSQSSIVGFFSFKRFLGKEGATLYSRPYKNLPY